jgi:nitroreductase
MRVSEAVNSRRSMRVFKPDPVPQADIEWIIENATRAAALRDDRQGARAAVGGDPEGDGRRR